jgi:hypothetical protein
MNLQEQIYRIQEMMGVVNEDALRKIKRRMGYLDKVIKSTYHWLDPKRFNNFEEFLQRVIFTTTRDFLTGEFDYTDYQQVLKDRDESQEFIKLIILDNYYNEIKEYFEQHTK